MIFAAVFKSLRRDLFAPWCALAALLPIVTCFSVAPAHATMVKCVAPNGKVSYQDGPCATSAAEAAVTVQVPPSAGPSSQAADISPVPSRPLNTQSRGRIPSHSDFQGPREAWQRLTQALNRGDRDAALKELTPSAQQRYSEMLERVSSGTKPAEVDHLGAVRSVTLTGDALATITLTRKKADGTHAYEVMLMRGADGKWRIDNM